MNINWAAPTIDIFNLFVDYPPMNINWAAPTIDIFNLDYPPIFNIFLTTLRTIFSRLVSCTNYYSPRMFQCIWNACMPFPIQSNHMQICKHAHIHIISNHTIMSCNYHFKYQN